MNPRTEPLWAALKAAGARHTVARHAVLEVLAGHDEHLTTADVHEHISGRFPSLEYSTVARTLAFLTELGLVHVLALAGTPRYGLADRPHHHAVCTSCGRVSELPTQALAAVTVQPTDGFRPATQGQTLLGVCASCQ